MFEHHTKFKGDYAVLKVQFNLYEKGFMVLRSQTEQAPLDLVAYPHNTFYRMQVKYRHVTKSRTL